MNKLLIFFVSVFTLSSCWYDNEEELFGDVNCPTENMSLSNDITPILNGNGCIGCHNNSSQSGGVNLEGFENIKLNADNGKLYGSVNHSDGFKKMPQGGARIDQCQIDKIKAWIDQGTLNN